MKIQNILICITIGVVCLSCKSGAMSQESVQGVYYKLNKDRHFNSSYMLSLNSDSTFTLVENHFEAKPQCDGKWILKDDKFIVLTCYPAKGTIEIISSGYISQRQQTLVVLSTSRLKYKDVILKRSESVQIKR